MTAKYATGDDDGGQSRWDAQTRHVLATWSCKPFNGHRHRDERVECRVVVEYDPEVGVDVLLEARSDDTGHFADEWQVVESIEAREYGARRDWRAPARWLA